MTCLPGSMLKAQPLTAEGVQWAPGRPAEHGTDRMHLQAQLSEDSVLAQHSAVGRTQRDQPRRPTGPATFPFSP